MSIRDAYQILLTMYVKGGGNPEDPQISFATVQRVVEEVRNEALQKIEQQDFPDKITLHFDGVVVTLGANQGKRRVEHLSVTATGLGKEWKLGVYEIASGKGFKNLIKHQSNYHVVNFVYNKLFNSIPCAYFRRRNLPLDC